MLKKTILLILLLDAVVFFGQKKLEVRLIYKVNLKQHDKKLNLKPGQKQYNLIAKKSGEKTLILDVKNYESYFYMRAKMKSDSDKKIDLLSAFLGDNKYYYNSLENSSMTEKNFLGESFIIIKKPNFSWNLTQEQLEIGNYTCYKATTVKEVTNRLGKKIQKKIVVWYTLEIPVIAGIRDFHGLPGAIVSLEAEGLSYKLSEIKTKLNNKIQITKPSKGKIVTQEEFDKILLRKYKIR